jgi:hypothetical protein
MREDTKQVLFLLALVLSLAALVAAVSWRLAEARREADATQNRPSAANGLEESSATHPSVHIVFFKPRSGA